MLNRIVLVGRLTKDPELRFTNNNNVPVVSFTLAVNRPFSSANSTNGSDNRDADFIPCIAWRKQAENVSKYVKKGHMVAVEVGFKREIMSILKQTLAAISPKLSVIPLFSLKAKDPQIL